MDNDSEREGKGETEGNFPRAINSFSQRGIKTQKQKLE